MLVLALLSPETLISQLYNVWQACLPIIAVLLAWRFKPWQWRIWSWVSRRLSSLSLGMGMVYLGICGLLIAMATGLAGKTPSPRIHDEFSYLLAGDTFAHGRLTNPTHPMWQFFETFHVIQHPTYMSKYPPGMGLVLAMGEVLAGIPLSGVWITIGLASAAAVWMLGAYVPRRWAVAGGLLVALHPLMGQWARSFWGGSLAALGGILVIGAIGHITRKPGIVSGVLLGIGASILAISRPVEGLVLCILAGGFVLVQLWRGHGRGRGKPELWRRTIVVAGIPAALIIGITGLWLAYYNHQVTGDWKMFPYVLCARQYEIYPPFIFQDPAPTPTYSHPEMAQFYQQDAGVAYREAGQGLYGVIYHFALQLNGTVGALLAPAAIAAFPLVLLQKPRRRIDMLLLLAVCLFGAMFCLETWRWSQYAAPGMGLVVVLLCLGIRKLCCWRAGQWHIGRGVVWGVLGAVALAAVIARATALSGQESDSMNARTKLIADLLATPGKYLVVVQYTQDHSRIDEWVYNGADIDGSAIVFARDMGLENNRRLLEYFNDRQVWLATVSAKEAEVEPYARARVRGTP